MATSYKTPVDIVPTHFYHHFDHQFDHHFNYHSKHTRVDSIHWKRPRSMSNSFDDSSSSTSGEDSSFKAGRRRRNKRRDNKKTNVHNKDRFLALDCEMVGLGDCGHISSLARVCIVDWDGEVLLDLYVRQSENVTDYRTNWSGIKAEHLTSRDVVDFDECHRRVKKLIRGKVLVGHGLKNDLAALKISHPWHQKRDTAKYEPFMKVRFNDGILWPRKLKDLAREEIGLDIQRPGFSHCPLEDARAALSLYRKASMDWEKLMEYKIKKTREIQDKKLLSDVFSRIDHLDSIFNSKMQRVDLCLTS